MNATSSLHNVDPRQRRRVLIALVPMFIVIVLIGAYWSRHTARAALLTEATAAQQSLLRVKVAPAVAVDGGRSLTLPGSLVAIRQAAVNARASGYVRTWRADIGDRVAKGFVLAEIATPEVDQQLDQARAALTQKRSALEQAIANLDFAKTTAAREDALLAESLSTKQTNDQAHAQVKIWEANVSAAKADIAAAKASVRTLEQLVSFGNIVAPFDGRITQRNIDVGSLVTAGAASGAAAGQPMFRIEAIDPMRVFIQVPQAFALSVKDGAVANVSIRELPDRVFEGKVTRTAGTLDPASRTLNVEIDIPNPTGELIGGMYGQATIAVVVAHRVVRVPSGAVITDARGVHVAVVDASGQVHLVAVTRGLDDGREIEIVDGLRGGEDVVANPGGDVVDGMRVDPARGAS